MKPLSRRKPWTTERSWLSEEVQTKGPRCAFDSVMDPSLLCEVMDHLLHQMSNSTFINDWVQNSQLCHLQVMFEDNGGGAGGPLDNLTEDDIVLLDGDYDEVRGSVVIQSRNSKYYFCQYEGGTVLNISGSIIFPKRMRVGRQFLDPRDLSKERDPQLLLWKRFLLWIGWWYVWWQLLLCEKVSSQHSFVYDHWLMK